ncbi:ead/Ea22-like family protein [Klebsiella spallanzanii]|nr:ead/Ea22-like family protein [Klebsiella spallanzanii]HBT1933605.1 ead/Ea22-like family protein [Klebsiella pneumoniae]HBT1943545.1 ead/Ea22-like family protein [Klebsiella pneumoniae]
MWTAWKAAGAELVEALERAKHDSAVDWEAAASLNVENQELKQRIAELEESNAQVIQSRDHYKRMTEEGLKKLAESRTVTAAAADVFSERQRQVTAEGWTPEHDDEYTDGELPRAASCYALMAWREKCLSDGEYAVSQKALPYYWPWDPAWWKPTSPRRDLVKAGALILAEIERIDRAAGIKWEAE